MQLVIPFIQISMITAFSHKKLQTCLLCHRFQTSLLVEYLDGLLRVVVIVVVIIVVIVVEHIGLVVRMSILDTEVDGSNPSISMFSP